ncbi:MAG: hypothetical protein ACRDZO_17590 [Egibacteraceae bacterium]
MGLAAHPLTDENRRGRALRRCDHFVVRSFGLFHPSCEPDKGPAELTRKPAKSSGWDLTDVLKHALKGLGMNDLAVGRVAPLEVSSSLARNVIYAQGLRTTR